MRKRSSELSAETPPRERPVKEKDELKQKAHLARASRRDADTMGCMKPVASEELSCPAKKVSPFYCSEILMNTEERARKCWQKFKEHHDREN